MEQSDDLPRSRSHCPALELASIWLHQSRIYFHLCTANASICAFYLAQSNSLSLHYSWGHSSFHWTCPWGYWAVHALYYRSNKSHRAISLRISLPCLGASSLLGDKHRSISTLLSQTQNFRIKRPPSGLQKDKFYLFFCGALQNAAFARHWDWRRREFTYVNDQAWMSKITQRVPCYTMST